MADTNINAYKQELVQAEKELDRAKARVESLKAHIVVVEGKPEESAKEETVEIVAKTGSSKKGKK